MSSINMPRRSLLPLLQSIKPQVDRYPFGLTLQAEFNVQVYKPYNKIA